MRHWFYARVSTDEQRERESIQNQHEFARKFFDLHQLKQDAVFQDDGVSGNSALESREGGATLLRSAQDRQPTTLWVFKLDRLGRNTRHILNAVDKLEALGVTVKSMTEPFDTSSSAGRFMLTMLAGVADLERENIFERMSAGIERAARMGKYLGGVVPFGFRTDDRDGLRQLVPSEEKIPGLDISEVDVVRMLFRMIVHEGKSCQWLACYVDALGVPTVYERLGWGTTRKGVRRASPGMWHPGTVRMILVNPLYKGIHTYGKRTRDGKPKRTSEIIERTIPAMVDEELWDAAQVALKRNMKFSRGNAKRYFLLRGIMKCAHCGMTYIGSGYEQVRKDGSCIERRYYACHGQMHSKAVFGFQAAPCIAKRVSSDIEEHIWSDIEGFLRDPGAVVGELQARMEAKANVFDTEAHLRQMDEQLTTLRASLQRIGPERETVVTLFRRGRIAESLLDSQLDDLSAQEMSLRADIAELEARREQTQGAVVRVDSVPEILAALQAKLDGGLSWETKRKIVEALVKSVVIHTTIKDNRKVLATAVVTYRFAVSAPEVSVALCDDVVPTDAGLGFGTDSIETNTSPVADAPSDIRTGALPLEEVPFTTPPLDAAVPEGMSTTLSTGRKYADSTIPPATNASSSISAPSDNSA